MKRRLNTIQKVEKLNEVFAIDDAGPGGAHHQYGIKRVGGDKPEDEYDFVIQLQNGPRKSENSIPGVIDTDLLEIVRDRLLSFQSSEFACRENAIALTSIEDALLWLNRRVMDRYERNVLGTYEK